MSAAQINHIRLAGAARGANRISSVGLPMLTAMSSLSPCDQRMLTRMIQTSVGSSRAPTTPFAQRRVMTARSSGSPLPSLAGLMQPQQALRMQSTQPTSSSSSSSSSDPPPPMPAAGKASSSLASPSSTSPPPVYQSAGSTPPYSSSVPSTSDISRVAPVNAVPASELGSPEHQNTVAQAQLAEKHALEKAKADAELEKFKNMPLPARVWAKVKEEAQHYWHGTKLLGKEMKISGRLLRRLLMGYNLTRREHRQLKRTTADLLRLIPFAPFIIIPFGELLLPVVIKIFPNMLPSTFESKFAVEEKRRGLIKVRLQMAKFLQGTIREGGIQAGDKLKMSDEFKEFFRKVRATGEQPSEEDIIKVAKLFEDDVTLDNLTRPQLVSMCRYMQINAFGTDNYLRYQIRSKLNRIRRDDLVIKDEGSGQMSLPELQSACQSRGIQTLGLDEDRLREELRQWIELHIKQRISGTLLILSKAFNYMPTGDENASSQLRSLEATLSSLPDNLIDEAELNVSKDSATNKQRLEVLQQQEELIEDEAEQEAEEEEARKVEKRRKDAEKSRLAQEEEEAKSLLPESETTKESQKKKQEEEADLDELRMTNEQLTELGEALSLLSAKSSVLKEREELAQLIREVSEVPEEDASKSISPETAAAAAESTSDKAASTTEEPQDPKEEKVSTASEEASASTSQSKASRSLAKRVKSMLETIDEQLEEYEKEVGSRMHIIEASPSGKISVDDLGQALRLIKHRPSEDVLERLVDSMDKDKDGLIPLHEVVALAEQESGLGIVREDLIQDITGQGKKLGEEVRGSSASGEKGDKDEQKTKGDQKGNKKTEKELRREDIVKD